jgi:hypothetical protein
MRASSSSAIPKPVFPLPVMPIITPFYIILFTKIKPPEFFIVHASLLLLEDDCIVTWGCRVWGVRII